MPSPIGLNTTEFGQYCWDNDLRIDWMIPLAGAHDGEECCDKLADLIEESDAKDLARIFGDKLARRLAMDEKEEKKYGGKFGRRERRTSVLTFLNDNRMFGYIVAVARPVKRYTSDKFDSAMLSWGYSRGRTLYVNDLAEDFFKKIEAFTKECEEADKKEYFREKEEKAKAAANDD